MSNELDLCADERQTNRGPYGFCNNRIADGINWTIKMKLTVI